MISGVAAGVFDWRENYYILQILKLSSTAVGSQLLALRGATLSKWTLIVTQSVLAIAFFGLSRLASWVGFAFALAAAIGLLSIWDYRIIAVVQLFVLITLLLLAIAALAPTARLG